MKCETCDGLGSVRWPLEDGGSPELVCPDCDGYGVMRLRDYMKDRKAKGFKPGAHYHVDGDFIIVHMKNDRYYTETVSEDLEVCKCMETNEVVGVKIHGAKKLVSK